MRVGHKIAHVPRPAALAPAEVTSCSTCGRTAAEVQRLQGPWAECSHIACTNRRRLTACPPDYQGDDE